MKHKKKKEEENGMEEAAAATPDLEEKLESEKNGNLTSFGKKFH